MLRRMISNYIARPHARKSRRKLKHLFVLAKVLLPGKLVRE